MVHVFSAVVERRQELFVRWQMAQGKVSKAVDGHAAVSTKDIWLILRHNKELNECCWRGF